MLRMDDLAFEVFLAGKFGTVSLVIIIIAGAHEQEARRKMTLGTAIDGFGSYMPASIGARPIGGKDPMAKMDMGCDPEFSCGFMDIFVDGRTVGNRLFM